MNEDDLEKCWEVAEQYWVAFGELIDAHLSKVPPELRSHLKMLLQEKSSVYGAASKIT